jgi:hypothetical protein
MSVLLLIVRALAEDKIPPLLQGLKLANLRENNRN